MSLPDFIAANVEPIVAEWEIFARSIWPKGSPADPIDLRNSAAEILRAVVADMNHSQTGKEQSDKSKGAGVGGLESDALDQASEVHGTARVGSGLNIREMVSEYRALRGSILRLWQESHPTANARDLDEITRFNESIDQSLARAVAAFSRRLDASREMFLAILGHDLRNPLAAITLSATVAQTPGTAEEQGEMLSQILTSANAISVLVTDLIEFTSSTMGVHLPLSRAPVDLDKLAHEVVGETRAANPGRQIDVGVTGNPCGQWDAHRLRQLLTNLLGNAMQHGAANEPVTVSIDGSAEGTTAIKVHNGGPPIPPEVLPVIFDPLVRGVGKGEKRRRPGSIGLGLFIAKEIATSHGGTIAMTSSATDGTTAIVNLPR